VSTTTRARTLTDVPVDAGDSAAAERDVLFFPYLTVHGSRVEREATRPDYLADPTATRRTPAPDRE